MSSHSDFLLPRHFLEEKELHWGRAAGFAESGFVLFLESQAACREGWVCSGPPFLTAQPGIGWLGLLEPGLVLGSQLFADVTGYVLEDQCCQS